MKIFFNSSMPRSMSTVFQNILGQNPEFYVTPTSGILDLLYVSRTQFTEGLEFKAQNSELMKKAFISYCRGGLFGFFKDITNKEYIFDKNRAWISFPDFIEEILGEKPKIVCLVRDIKSIMSSAEKMYRNNPYYYKNIVDYSSLRGTTLEKRIDLWLSTPPIGLMLDRIRESIIRGWDKNILFIRAEDLCKTPEVIIKKVYNYLELPFYQHSFNKIEQITEEDDSIYGLDRNLHKIRTCLEYVKPDYKDILGYNICRWLDENLSWYQKYFNYNSL